MRTERRQSAPFGTKSPEIVPKPVRAPFPFVVERDDDSFGLGWHGDAPGPFASGGFAEAVAAKGGGVMQWPTPKKTKPHAREARGQVFLKGFPTAQ
jgi:hypothetical protein